MLGSAMAVKLSEVFKLPYFIEQVRYEILKVEMVVWYQENHAICCG